MDGITLTNALVEDQVRGRITRNSKGGLDAPDHIIKTASAARALYSPVRLQNLNRIALWAAIEGLIAGNAPYDQRDLDSHGLSYMTNYNDLSARSRFEKEVLAYFHLLHGAERLLSFEIDLPDPAAHDWALTMSIEGSKLLRNWASFSTMMGTNIGQLSKLGMSVVLWPDERDWRPRTTEIHRFSIPDQTSTDMDQFTFCFLENDFTAQYLFEVYDRLSKDKSEEELNDLEDYSDFWNLKTLSDVLLYRANSIVKANNNGAGITDFFSLQQAIQNGDFSLTQLYGDGIRLITLLYKEYDGEITHYMFDNIWTGNSFIFMADRQYKDWGQALAIFTVSPLEFTFHSNKGIGHKIFAPCQAKNQLACSAVDMARFGSTPLLRQESGAVREIQQIKMFPGVPTDIGGAEFVQNNLGNNLQQVISVLTYMDQNLSINLGMSGDDPAFPEGTKASVGSDQARLQRAPRATLLRHHTAHFLEQLDRVYRTMFSIILRSKKGYPGWELCKNFKEKCLEKGVPEFVFDVKDSIYLPEFMSVKATRIGGDGTPEGLLLALTDLEPVVPLMGPKEQNAYKKDRILAAMGSEALPRYTQETESADEFSSGASDAGVENAIMQLGFSPIFSRTNDQESHLSVHMDLNIDTMNKVQQQQLTPIEAQKIFDMSIPHTQEHWKALLDRLPFGEAFVNEWKGPYDQVIQYAALNRKNAIKMYEAAILEQQQAEENQQKVLSEMELKALQVQGDEARKNFTTERKEARQEKESQTRADIKKRDVELKAENERYKAQLQNGVDNQRAANENSLEQNRLELQRLVDVETPIGEI